MKKKNFFEIWIRKKDKKGRLAPFSFIQAFPYKKWQFAIKLRRKFLDKDYQVLLKEVAVVKEEKMGSV